jgi:hypothetical protein
VDSRFREALESQKKDKTPRLPLLDSVHSHDLKDVEIFGRFFNFFFQGFVV